MGACFSCLPCVNDPLAPPADTKAHSELIDRFPDLESFDILLFSCPQSKAVQKLEGSRWTHVALVYKRDGVNTTQFDKVVGEACLVDTMIMEALAGSGEERIAGLDLTEPETRINRYLSKEFFADGGYIGLRKLNVERTPEMLQALEQLYLDYKDKTYETRVRERLESLCCFKGVIVDGKKQDESAIFCSEVVSKAYQVAGLLAGPENGGYAADAYCPADWGTDRDTVKLLKGELGPIEIYCVK